jgi:hypothetical protein
VLILRADNRGEGGILALMALAVPPATERRGSYSLLLLGLFGAALLYGDGMITPAISVLSAIEGLTVATPVFAPYVIPLTVAVLVGLFALQRRGTGALGALFGPITVAWFSCLAVLGVAALRAPDLERPLLPFGLFARRRVRNLREQTPRFGPAFERQLVEDVQEAMVPAPLLLRLGEHRRQRPPDPEMSVADHELRRLEAAPLEIPQDRRPALRRFAIATLDGEDDLLPGAPRGQDDEDRRLVLLEPGLTSTRGNSLEIDVGIEWESGNWTGIP